MIRWADPAPVFWDCETQSACDLKASGGRLYAEDPTTRVLCAVFWVDGVFHVWIPSHHELKAAPDVGKLWPAQLGPAQPMKVWRTIPWPVRQAAWDGRTFVAHNCFNFDRHIWEHVIKPEFAHQPLASPAWADTLPLARAAGLPGKLDALAQAIANHGKDAGHRILLKHIHATVEGSEVKYSKPGAGDFEVILRYNVADVDLLRRAWEALADVPVEADVIAVHDTINERGVGLDVSLAAKLVGVSKESVGRAAERIAELTGGALHAGNLRSTKQVNEWLDGKGVKITDYSGKRTLRKDFVSQALANPWTMLEDDAPVAAVKDIDPAVFEVLRLRSAALRITGAKGERATARASADGRARDLFSYWQAHTGRWSSAGIHMHNLPRPKKGVPVGALLAAHESGAWGADAKAAYELIAGMLKPPLTVDDALGALLRPLFVPRAGDCFAICDYAAVECRGVAWIAGEEALLHELATGVDVYKAMASRIFGCAVADVTDTQRQVGKVTVLGCGYSMSAEKFRLYCGLQGIDLAAAGTSAEQCVDAFRGAYPAIAGSYAGVIDGRPYRTGGLWSQLGKAALNAVLQGGVQKAGKTTWVHDGVSLICTLPSGRQLRYRNARVEDRVPGYARALGIDRPKATLVYEGAFGEAFLYGGKITENVVQALCRDLMATALVHAERGGLRPVAHVHDEIMCEVPLATRAESLNSLATVMTTVPPWAQGFPIAVEGFCAPRYLKAAPDGWEHCKRSCAT